MEGVCKLCGCTDSTPCMVDGEPCAWIMDDLCTACVVEVGNYMFPKDCQHCGKIQEGAPYRGRPQYTCSEGRFDPWPPNDYPGKHQWYAASGISRPNKKVKEAQFKCPVFELREKYREIGLEGGSNG